MTTLLVLTKEFFKDDAILLREKLFSILVFAVMLAASAFQKIVKSFDKILFKDSVHTFIRSSFLIIIFSTAYL